MKHKRTSKTLKMFYLRIGQLDLLIVNDMQYFFVNKSLGIVIIFRSIFLSELVTACCMLYPHVAVFSLQRGIPLNYPSQTPGKEPPSIMIPKMLTFHKSRRNSKQRQSFSSFLLEIA